MSTSLAIVVWLSLTICAFGQGIPKGYTIPASTLSPDRRYGVAVPMVDELLNSDKGDGCGDIIVETKRRRVVAEIQGEAGWDRALNFLELAPTRWSSDGAILVWEVSGKWCPNTLTVLKLNQGEVQWQTDVLHLAQQAIISHTKKAAPEKFAIAKKANAGNGSAFPEGFTVDVRIAGQTTFPLHVEAVLGSDPKQTGRLPKLGSRLQGVVDSEGKFVVISFHLTSRSSGQFSE